ncbi:MAG: gfo/Idh/MocA family oxidoreductase [Chloroflexi bacterium]|nr:MAG: gfo/Idh/MocA family oxidoreductase [Chloroflexota bacterium]MBL1192798.1 gfo/Idh/MocA family oxidoreductase [Chloroflexota bacterium]NOH10092.1 Gfo/Idh/MocA family oxidoreductase [Chloroflexota bacterium]
MLRVGLIGTGVALRTHLPGFRRTGQAEVVGLVGSSLERATHFARQHNILQVYSDYQELCEADDIDLIVVASPNSFHHQQVKYALQQGKHVLAEKPLAMNLQEIEELVELAANSDRLALIDHQLRFSPYMQTIKEHIQEGKLGRLYFIRFHFQGGSSDPQRAFDWHFDESMGGGVRLAMASHLTDLLWFWLESRKVYNVHGRMDSLVPQRKDATGQQKEVTTSGFFTAHISLEDNLEVQMSDTMAFGESQFTIALYGTRGELYFDAQCGLEGAFVGGESMQPIAVDMQNLEQARPDASIFRQSFDLFARQIVRSLQSGDHKHIPDAAHFQDAVPTQRVLDAIRHSTLSGEVIQLSEGYRPGASS